MCWANLLVDQFHQFADVPVHKLDSVDDGQDDPDDVTLDDVGCPAVVGVTDAVSLAGPSTSSMPKPIKWPWAWESFVNVVRGAGAPMFFGMFRRHCCDV